MNLELVKVIAPKIVPHLERLTHWECALLAVALDPGAERVELLTALRGLTEGQRAFVGVKSDNPGMSDKAAALEAGLSCPPESEKVDQALALALEWKGAFADLTDDQADQVLAEVIRDWENRLTQVKALDIYYKLRNRYPAKKIEQTGKDGGPIRTAVEFRWKDANAPDFSNPASKVPDEAEKE